ncbi:hypothetical protein Tco_0410778 [Tanacetum coccineum]
MDNTRAQQKTLDDELVAPVDQFWVTVFRHHSLLRFKLNGKSHTVNVDNFRDMLKIYTKLPGQIFEEPLLEEEILSFIRDLGHTGEIKFLSNVNVNHMHQPWRSFAAIINKCLSEKTTTLESLRLSRAQILWGMYHIKTVDYVYLMWEDLVYQVENKIFKKNNDMDDFMFTIVRVISKHQDTQVYGAILPQHLTSQAMLESEAYMTYHDYATGEKTSKPKTTKKKADSESSPKTKSTQASKGKRITTLAKGDKPAKKKQSVTKSKGLTVLSEVALTEAQQMKIAIERNKIQTHSSHTSGSGDGVDIQSKVPDEHQQNISSTNEGAGNKPEVPDIPEYRSESKEESWTYNQGEDDDIKINEDDNCCYGRRKKEDEEDEETMKDPVNVVVQLKSNKLREEAQAENDKFLKQIDSNIKTIIKDQKSAQAEEHGIRVDDLEEPLHQEFNTRNDDISHVREIIDVDERL